MSRIAITNVNIFDGSGEDTFKGEVLVEDKRIVDIVRSPQRVSTDGARVIGTASDPARRAIARAVIANRDMAACLADNAPAVGYSSIPISGQGVKPCF